MVTFSISVHTHVHTYILFHLFTQAVAWLDMSFEFSPVKTSWIIYNKMNRKLSCDVFSHWIILIRVCCLFINPMLEFLFCRLIRLTQHWKQFPNLIFWSLLKSILKLFVSLFFHSAPATGNHLKLYSMV